MTNLMRATEEAEGARRRLTEALAEGHKRAGSVPWRKLERRLVGLVGERCPTHETLRLWHTKQADPTTIDLDVIAGLARLYGEPQGDFGLPELAERFERSERVRDFDATGTR